jgi:hypothetical protein
MTPAGGKAAGSGLDACHLHLWKSIDVVSLPWTMSMRTRSSQATSEFPHPTRSQRGRADAVPARDSPAGPAGRGRRGRRRGPLGGAVQARPRPRGDHGPGGGAGGAGQAGAALRRHERGGDHARHGPGPRRAHRPVRRPAAAGRRLRRGPTAVAARRHRAGAGGGRGAPTSPTPIPTAPWS